MKLSRCAGIKFFKWMTMSDTSIWLAVGAFLLCFKRSNDGLMEAQLARFGNVEAIVVDIGGRLGQTRRILKTMAKSFRSHDSFVRCGLGLRGFSNAGRKEDKGHIPFCKPHHSPTVLDTGPHPSHQTKRPGPRGKLRCCKRRSGACRAKWSSGLVVVRIDGTNSRMTCRWYHPSPLEVSSVKFVLVDHDSFMVNQQ